MHTFRSYIFAARIACDSGPTCTYYRYICQAAHQTPLTHLSSGYMWNKNFFGKILVFYFTCNLVWNRNKKVLAAKKFYNFARLRFHVKSLARVVELFRGLKLFDHPQRSVVYNFSHVCLYVCLCVFIYSVFQKKWRQNKNHNNCDKSYQN